MAGEPESKSFLGKAGLEKKSDPAEKLGFLWQSRDQYERGQHNEREAEIEGAS